MVQITIMITIQAIIQPLMICVCQILIINTLYDLMYLITNCCEVKTFLESVSKDRATKNIIL